MPRDRKPSGISDAAIKGARKGEEQAPQPPPADAKTVDPDQVERDAAPGQMHARKTENDEAPMGGAPVAFPAPSAQPTRVEPVERPAKIDVSWVEDEEDDTEWQRAGGGEEPKKPDKPQ